MPRLAASGKQVTDGQVIKAIHARGIDDKGVEFSQDYAHRGLGKGHSPFAKFYRNLNGKEHWMVVSGLPMTDCDGDPCTPGWLAQGASGRYVAKNNQYRALIQGQDVQLSTKNDDPFGRKKGATLAYSPRLFVGGVEIPATAPVLVPVDPWNANYQQNVLEWDYGVCKRKLRTVEGRVHGYWVFPANPGGDVLIRYGQTGDYRLKLGQFRQTDDEEFILASVFASVAYPFEVSDSATYNPDADPETTSVDGRVAHNQTTDWQTLRTAAGNVGDPNAVDWLFVDWSGDDSEYWTGLGRSIFLFDTSGLPDGATLSAATLSLYGSLKSGQTIVSINIYLSTPASNTNLVAGDFTQIGTVAQSTAITYAGWSITGYNDFLLNDLTKVSLTSVSKFGSRDVTYDVGGSNPSPANGNARIQGYYAEQGAGYKPKLVVTYTVPVDYPRTAEVALGLSV